MTRLRFHTVFLPIFLLPFFALAQTDPSRRPVPVDTLARQATALSDAARIDSLQKAFSPKKATLRSLMVPGWGQLYVGRHKKGSFLKKYWKVPVVYGALGTSAGIFFYNLSSYREIRFAYNALFKASQPRATAADSVDYFNIKPYLRRIDLNSLRTFRDEARTNIDYSVLAFLILWGLQVAEATADAHLLAFDVSPDLSFNFKLGPSSFAGTTGVTFLVRLKDTKDRKPPTLRLPF